ncbi:MULTISPECIES: DUF5753 domain-containing protein [unclassified Streptomyces]|uniref:DUF5753 domain-containing protein n=1 Tax=unclassified Streptomyces TaxID=2593676 RepID=UPI0032535B0E
MSVNTNAMVARQRFGEAIQGVRLEARTPKGQRIKQIDVARVLKRKTIDRVSRIERGQAWPTEAELAAMLTLFGADVAVAVRLETMLSDGRAIEGAWWTEFDDEFPESLIQFCGYEDAATRITTCAGNLVPGLLQTPGYGRAVTGHLSKSTLTEALVQRSVDLRANRRRVFDKANPPAVEAIIGEAALRQEVGGTAMMVEQLDSLIDDATRRNVTLRVIPFSAKATLTYFFHFFEFGGASENPIAAFDAMTGMSFEKRPREVRGIRGLLESSKELSLSPLDSLEAIRAVRNEMSRD